MSDTFDLGLDLDSAVQEMNKPKTADGIKLFGKDDDRIWKPDMKKSAIYQFFFIPYKDAVTKKTILTGSFSTHSFKVLDPKDSNKSSTVYGVCAKTLGQPCKICDYAWDGFDKNAPDAVKNKRKMYRPQNSEYVNILMIKDPLTPENNGKVFLYKLPVSLKKLINERINPDDKNKADEDFIAFNPFNPGCTGKFKLDVTVPEKTTDFVKYDKSKFNVNSKADLCAIANTKEEAIKIIDSAYDIQSSINEFTEAKLLTEEKIMKSAFARLIGGTYVPEEVTSIPDNHRTSSGGSVDVSSDDGVTDDEQAWLDNV